MPFLCNLNARPKVWCKPLSVFDVSWILSCLALLHSLTWCVCKVIAMSCEVVILVVQLDICFFPLLSTKKLFDSSQLTVLLHVEMLPLTLLFLFVGTYQRSWFDEPWLLNNMTSSTLHWKTLQCLERKKKNLQLYLLRWILILIECVH
jgi:hypothetical protein